MYSEFGISIFNLDDKIFLESARKKLFFYRRLGFSITSENVFLEVGALQELLDSPSASCTRGRPSCTRGSLPRVQHSGKSLRLILSRESRLPRVSKIVHSGKALPSAVLALGEDLTPLAAGRRRFFFIFFPECNTRERFLNFFFKYSLPSAAAQALGKEICFFF